MIAAQSLAAAALATGTGPLQSVVKTASPDWDRLTPILIESVWETLYMVAITMGVGGLAGLLMGILLFTTRPGSILSNKPSYNVLNVLVNFVRPIPFIIFLTFIAPVTLWLIGTNIGTEAVIFPMATLAAFGIARIVEQNLVTVDPGVIEAARAMGASPVRIIVTVLVPETLGPLILGYTFAFIAVVDMSAMAGYIGGGGLGAFAIQYGYQRYMYEVTLAAVVLIVVLVQAVQFFGNHLARKALRR